MIPNMMGFVKRSKTMLRTVQMPVDVSIWEINMFKPNGKLIVLKLI